MFEPSYVGKVIRVINRIAQALAKSKKNDEDNGLDWLI